MATQELETLPIIGEKQVASLLEWQPLINAMETALNEFSAGKVAQPVRQIVPVPGHDAIIAAMPAIGTAMAVKIVTLYHSNAGTDIPTHQGVILVLDKETGSPLALLDGRLITEMRTAAGSAAAVRKLAPKSVDVVTIMGNGVQAEAHVDALAEVIEWKELRLWARDETKGRKVADRVGATFFPDAEAAVQGADIVACTTAAKQPILQGAWLKPGAFVTAVGWNTSEGRELDDSAMDHTVIVESSEAARDQAGNIRGANCAIFAEAGEIYSGLKSVPEGSTVIYDSVGIAIMDVAAAKLVYDLWLAAQE
ncbi:ornithine cyclodeaminase family protein [Ruegeria sp. AU67]|uniref:ornithine cyclodeaminase family protein n=1 Tax=Ruegeria sp. AU67 TaxID=2108530 RepID=UPI000D69770B|nr:ornithine cyclodeaminase family protein [Ruegeria sp. AU67]